MALPADALKMPGVALAAAGALTLAPALVAPAAVAPPSVQMHVEDIRLTGIGQDIYYAITPWAQYAVGGASYLINFIPLVGGPTAAQININYFQGVQPVIEATVNYLAGVVQDPFNFVPTTAAYGEALFDIGYNWVSAQLMFIGLPPLQPLPQGAAAVRPGAVTRIPAPAAAEVAAAADATDADAALAARRTSARPPLSDSAVLSTRESLGVVRESLRGGHSGTARASTATVAGAAAARHSDVPESKADAGAPHSAKVTARR